MIDTLGIIPAGGKAVRFGGIYKELLPISENECGLSRCIRSMRRGGAGKIVVATNWIRYEHINLDVTVLEGEYLGMWEVIEHMESLGNYYNVNRYLFAMPDTVYPLDIFERMPKDEPVCIGTFETAEPQRFGVIHDGRIVDKQKLEPGMYKAWGVWSWSGDVMPVLVDALRAKKDHTAAFNLILDAFGYHETEMKYYYDFASFEHYRDFLCNTRI